MKLNIIKSFQTTLLTYSRVYGQMSVHPCFLHLSMFAFDKNVGVVPRIKHASITPANYIYCTLSAL